MRLEPLDPARHGDELFAAGAGTGADDLWRYLADGPYRGPRRLRALADARRASRTIRSSSPFATRRAAASRAASPSCASITPTASSRPGISCTARGWRARPPPPRPSICRPATSSTSSAIAASNGNATTPMSARSGRPCASASASRACSANIWSSRAATATRPGSPCLTASGRRADGLRALARARQFRRGRAAEEEPCGVASRPIRLRSRCVLIEFNQNA